MLADKRNHALAADLPLSRAVPALRFELQTNKAGSRCRIFRGAGNGFHFTLAARRATAPPAASNELSSYDKSPSQLAIHRPPRRLRRGLSSRHRLPQLPATSAEVRAAKLVRQRFNKCKFVAIIGNFPARGNFCQTQESDSDPLRAHESLFI